MLEFDTSFRQQVRSLKSPNSPQFDPAKWRTLIETANPADTDLNLCATAMWLAAQAMSLREKYAQTPCSVLGAELSTALAIATLNQQHSVLGNKVRQAHQAAARAGTTLTTDQLANLPIASHEGFFEVDPGSRTDALTDAVDSWLYEAASAQAGTSSAPNLGDTAVEHLRRFSVQRGHYDLWQQALWLDWRLTNREGHFFFTPGDQELAELTDAWVHREQSNFMGFAWLDMAMWPDLPLKRRRDLHLPLTVIAADQRPGRRRRLVVSRPSGSLERVPPYRLVRSGLEGSYLAPFLERPLPAQPDLTAALLLRAWYILHDLAEVLVKSLPRATFNDVENVRRWALIVRKDEAVDVLRQALSVTDKHAEKIVAFLSWSQGTYKGLWGAPLVPLPGKREAFALAQTVLATSNMVRTVEIWLTKGGLDDRLAHGSRGDSFEAQLRIEVADALKGNAIMKDTASSKHSIKKTADFPEQIDLLVKFGPLLLVGELKCLLFPADARERYNFLRNLKRACEQASRKAAAIDGRRDIAAQGLGIATPLCQALRILPIVVLNQGFGMSLLVDGCVVTDVRFLKIYLGSGSYTSEAAFNHVDGAWADASRHLYHTEMEAADKFEATMRRPPPLYRFRDLLRWTTFAFPTASGDPLMIAQTEFADLPEDTRARYATLGAVVDH